MNFKPCIRLAANLGLSLIYAFLGFALFYICFKPYIEPVRSVFGVISGSSATIISDSIFVPMDITDIDNQPKDIPLSEVVVPKYGQQFGELEIESVDLKQDLYMGDSLDILRFGVGLNTSTMLPGFGTRILMCGHNTSPYLKPIENVKKDDIITIRTSYGNYEYKIFDIIIADASDTSAYNFDVETETLILYTCYPFELGFDSTRYFVYGKKISGPDIIR